MKTVLFFTLLLLLYRLCDQQKTIPGALEADLLKSIKFLDVNLKEISTLSTSCVASAKFSSLNLKAAAMPRTLTDPLDNLVNYLTELKIPDYFGSLTKCLNLTNCECLSFRIVILDSHIKKIDSFIEIFSDLQLHKLLESITWNYALNFRQLQPIWTREVSIWRVITQTRLLSAEFFDIIRIFDYVKKYFNDQITFLTSDISTCKFSNSSFYEQGNETDENLRSYQTTLKDFCLIALTKINISLSIVASSSSRKVEASVNDRLPLLKKLYDKLKSILTCDDYLTANLRWPRIPDSTGEASGRFMKVRSCHAKKESYSFIKKKTEANNTEVKTLLDAFKAAISVTSSRKVRAASQDIDVLNSTNNVMASLTQYSNQLTISIASVETLRLQIESTLCGLTIDFNTNNPNDPATLGFYSGTYKDSSAVWPGIAGYQAVQRPARVTTKSPTGAYATSASAVVYVPLNVTFYRAHPNLKWVSTPTSSSSIASVPGKISIRVWSGDLSMHYLIRYNFSANFQQIGWMWVSAAGVVSTPAYYWDGTAVKPTTGNVDILVCQ